MFPFPLPAHRSAAHTTLEALHRPSLKTEPSSPSAQDGAERGVTVEDDSDEKIGKPKGWPAESHLFVTENGSGYDVYTRDLRGRIHHFSTSRWVEAPTTP